MNLTNFLSNTENNLVELNHFVSIIALTTSPLLIFHNLFKLDNKNQHKSRATKNLKLSLNLSSLDLRFLPRVSYYLGGPFSF